MWKKSKGYLFIDSQALTQIDYILVSIQSVTKYLRLTTYKEERLIMAHGFRGFNAWIIGSVALGL